MASADQRWEITIKGIVQGVGFRPFIYNLAHKHLVRGFVINNSDGVRIEAEGKESQLERFFAAISAQKPPQALISSIESKKRPPAGYAGFFIRESEQTSGFSLISPDIATCSECCDEIFAHGRRHNYAFTNCTNCGPRFTIIEDMPYDRPNTTMKTFEMCEECRAEYENPRDRRFHAQPIACPKCGPSLSLVNSNGQQLFDGEDALNEAARAIKEGKIVAIKGLGGFLLACDAASSEAVGTLRQRKHRPHKPLAVMVRNSSAAESFCTVNVAELSLLSSPQAPIVLLNKKEPVKNIAENVAPDNAYIGVMLPYTPLHHLLMAQVDTPLVMTSGNISEEPICIDNDEALKALGQVADVFLMHNRPIACGYDDSVAFVEGGQTFMVRRARGYAPYPINLNFKTPMLAAFGSNDKNTFTLTREKWAFVSAHIGDMGYTLTDEHFDNTLQLYKRLFKIEPLALCADKHPLYASTIKAKEEATRQKLPIALVQHHHAHIASCMAENGLDKYAEVIGLSFDGTGYGDDGKIWGGEVLVCDYGKSRQFASLQYLPLAGGEAAVIHPARLAYGYLKYLGIDEIPSSLNILSIEEQNIIAQQIEKDINAPLSSSMGRLFDACAAILGFNQSISYDAQAAIALENMALKSNSTISYGVNFDTDENGVLRLNLKSIFEDILGDIKRHNSASDIARRLHNTIARFGLRASEKAREQTAINKVCLSGGCLANRLLLKELRSELNKSGFEVYYQKNLPSNDGGLSLGQAAVAAMMWQKGSI